MQTNILKQKIYLAAAISALALMISCSKKSSTTPAPNGKIVAGTGTSGTALNQFAIPNKITFDGSGNLYVSDAGNSRVTKWAPGASQGTIVAGNGTAGAALNELDAPKGIFSDAAGDIYIADQNNYRVVEWPSGATQGTLVAGGNGAGSNLNQIGEPNSVYVDGQGNIYVSDSYNNWVEKWAPGAPQATIVAGSSDGEYGAGLGVLNGPRGISVDASGNLYICDQSNSRVVEWASGATSGKIVAGTGTAGTGLNQLNGPTGIFVDKSGNIYVADYYNARVVKWAPGATSGTVVAGVSGVAGSALNQLNFPNDVYVDASGNLYVADADNYRIMEWPAQ
jgi:sugar lactone lactonase YvrE